MHTSKYVLCESELLMRWKFDARFIGILIYDKKEVNKRFNISVIRRQ